MRGYAEPHHSQLSLPCQVCARGLAVVRAEEELREGPCRHPSGWQCSLQMPAGHEKDAKRGMLLCLDCFCTCCRVGTALVSGIHCEAALHSHQRIRVADAVPGSANTTDNLSNDFFTRSYASNTCCTEFCTCCRCCLQRLGVDLWHMSAVLDPTGCCLTPACPQRTTAFPGWLTCNITTIVCFDCL